MTNLDKLLTEFKEARSAATEGHYNIHRMDSDCGYFNFMLEAEISSDKDHIIAHFSEQDNINAKRNSEYIKLAANNSAKLIKIIEVMKDVLNEIELKNAVNTESYILANEALQQAEQIAGQNE